MIGYDLSIALSFSFQVIVIALAIRLIFRTFHNKWTALRTQSPLLMYALGLGLACIITIALRMMSFFMAGISLGVLHLLGIASRRGESIFGEELFIVVVLLAINFILYFPLARLMRKIQKIRWPAMKKSAYWLLDPLLYVAVFVVVFSPFLFGLLAETM